MQVSASAPVRAKRSENPWLFFPEDKQSANFRLFCFSYAGGNANTFRNWPRYLSEQIELIAIQYPGRATRFKEKSIDSMGEMVDQLLDHLKSEFNEKPYAFFGHSMGASIAFELARKIANENNSSGRKLTPPSHLIVSGRRGPKAKIEKERKPIHNLPQEDFLKRLRELNGTPEELLQHDDLMDLMEPILRSDFKLVETWKYKPQEVLSIPLSIYGGKDDQHIDEGSLNAWQLESDASSNIEVFPGDHFYLLQHEQRLVEKINNDLVDYLP
jgi:medium-chain acyl-[acyl-carrier-protein] hydrolase